MVLLDAGKMGAASLVAFTVCVFIKVVAQRQIRANNFFINSYLQDRFFVFLMPRRRKSGAGFKFKKNFFIFLEKSRTYEKLTAVVYFQHLQGNLFQNRELRLFGYIL